MAHIAIYLAVSAVFAASATPLAEVHSVAVTLVRAPGPPGPQTASAVDSSASLDRLQQSLTTTDSAAPTPKPLRDATPQTRLSELLGEATPQAAHAPIGGGPPAAASGAAGGGAGIDPYAYAALFPSGAQQAADRSLRDQVARCWRRGASWPLVRVRVILDARGGLAEAPKVLTPSGLAGATPSPAVAEALNAVRTCAPYATVAARAGTPQDLEFR